MDLETILSTQRPLSLKFLEKENHNLPELRHSIPLTDVYSCKNQAVIRNQITYILCEIGEAEVIRTFDNEMYVEECADVFHFIIELFIMYGLRTKALQELIDEEEVPDILDWTFDKSFARLLLQTAYVIAHLKSKPWKGRARYTDVDQLHIDSVRLFLFFLDHCKSTGVNEETLINGYFKKVQINEARISATT